MMDDASAGERLAHNPTLTLLWRGLALGLLSLVAYLSASYIGQIREDIKTAAFHAQSTAAQQLVDERAADAIQERVAVLEAQMATAASASAEAQRQTLQRLDTLQSSVINVSNGVAALTATLKERDRRGGTPD